VLPVDDVSTRQSPRLHSRLEGDASAPQLVRKGGVIRVAGTNDESTLAAPAYAMSFVDLRFEDGHVERWRGSGFTFR
jgi:hypothetical protein